MYLAMGTRPDLAYGVGLVSRFASNPGEVHVKAVKRILRYLRTTTSIGLVFGGSGKQVLVGYADADYAGCASSRRSTSGYVFLYGRAALGWGSKKQECVALSTTEAEYIALCTATREAAWLRGLLGFLRCVQHTPTTMYQDNQSTIVLVNNGQTSRRTKHIEVRFHYTRSKILDGTIRIEYCPIGEMIADRLTKALTPSDSPNFEMGS
jgi:hypothetical protein